MRKYLVLIIVLFLLTISPTYAIFQKKDYKKNFLQNALKAEKRNNTKSAFYIYEKTMFYYKDDKQVLEAYAGFCERKKYYDKAQTLYQKLFDLTKDEYYLFKKYTLQIKNNKSSNEELKKIFEDKRLTSEHKKKINSELILKSFYSKDWKKTKNYCDKISKKELNADTINACTSACEKLGDKTSAYKYYLRQSEIYPEKTDVVKKILELSEEYKDYEIQEKFLKKFSDLNPQDKGIKYRLAGFYEKQKQQEKAIKIYEELINQGDKSKHVLSSYEYLTKKTPEYKPKPLTPQELMEQKLYFALNNKDFASAEKIIDELLKKNPESEKFIKLRANIALATQNYKEAIAFFEKIKNRTIDEEKLLALSYAKNENYLKALEIIESQLKKESENQILLNLALEYSMAEKNWEKAIVFNEKLLVYNSKEEKYLKNRGDFYSLKKDFKNAAKAYEKLIEIYPKSEYKITLFNFYTSMRDFESALAIIEPVYKENNSDLNITKMYLNALISSNKIQKGYEIVKKHHLEKTKEGLHILGDMAMLNKNYDLAKDYYFQAIGLDPENYYLRTNLGQSLRMLKQTDYAQMVYEDVLQKDSCNLNARLGLGYLEIDRKNYKKAREIFEDVLNISPRYKPAQIGVAYSYIANGDNFQTLDTLDKIRQDNQIAVMRAQTYYDMGMPSKSKEVLRGIISKDADDLRYKIKRDEAITIVPTYTFFKQNLAQQFNLDYNQVGTRVSQKINNNLDIFTEYNMYVYSSGQVPVNQPNQTGSLNNVTNEVRGGVQGRPTEKLEFRADIGTKIFQFDQGFMINTDSWVKHYFSDDFNLKAGFKRNNLEQSYLSAVGMLVDGVFTGQVADNKAYLEYEKRLPNQFYSFGRYGLGSMTAQNLPNNPYMEGMVGIGRVMYYNPENNWINLFNLDLVSYNMGFQRDLLKIFDNQGNLYGGYFSPSFFTANTLAAKIEGKIKKINLKYGLKGFGGPQFAKNPHLATVTWGISPYLAYDLNDNVSFNLAYNHYNFGDIQRDIFTFNMVIRGFERRAKR